MSAPPAPSYGFVDSGKVMGEAPPPYPGGPAGQVSYGTASYGPNPNMAAGQAPTNPVYVMPGGGSTTTTTVYSMQPNVVPAGGATIIVTGNCPRCHVGRLHEESNIAMCIVVAVLAILFFPIGLLYFLCLPGSILHRCDHCGYAV